MAEDFTDFDDNLESYVKDYKIFIDTCSLLYEFGDNFWIRLIELLEINNRFLFIPSSVINELAKCAESRTLKPEVIDLAQKRYFMIQQLQDNDLVKIYGNSQDNFADNVFQVAFTRYRMKYKLLLITQDNDLALDILKLNETRSTQANEVVAKRIGKNGTLTGYKWQNDDNIQPFRICTETTKIPAELLSITTKVKSGSKVFTSKQNTIELGEEIASGGEGIIYKTNTDYVAKIYKPENLTKIHFEKLKLMLSRPIKLNGLCWPIDALYNVNNEFVGFLMPTAKGKEIQRSIFHPRLFQKYFPDWKKRDTVELCVTILQKILYLHKHNIIIGDINPANILVVSQKEVYFVDVDSYQIEDFPCPVGTINFTAPEIQRKSFSNFLRTMGNENFAVATLMFMIMLLGKTPYAQQGGEDPATNIINMDFSYPLGAESNRRAPEGPWHFMWSHMTFKVKEAFYKTFRKGEAYADEEHRINAGVWLNLFREYLNLLDSGKMAERDPMSEIISPTRFKISKDKKYIKCKICGEPILEESGYVVCRNCGEKEIESYKCSGCGKDMVFTYNEKYNMGYKHGYEYCRECNSKVAYTAYCTNCGDEFELTGSEKDYFTTRGLDLPRICQNCRNRNKTIVQCPICGRDVKLGDTRDGYCTECLAKVITYYNCERCGKAMHFTNFDKYIKHMKTGHTHCKECSEIIQREREFKNQIGYEGYCTNCGRKFEMTNGEKDFYTSRGLELPKRCAKCRNSSTSIPQKPSTPVAKSIFSRIFGKVFS